VNTSAERHVGLPTFQQLDLYEQIRRAPALSAAYDGGIPLVFAPGQIDAHLLEAAIGWVRRRHAALRTRMALHGGALVQVIDAVESDWHLEREEWAGSPQQRVSTLEARSIQTILGGDPLFGATLARCEGGDLLVLRLHHFVSDGWSDELLLKEISTRYTALESGEYPDADEPATSYLEFAEAQHEEWIARRCGAIDRLGSVTEGMIVPSLFPHGAGRPYDAAVAQVTRTLSDRCAARLEAAAGLHRMTPFTLLLACTALAVIDERDVPGCLIGSNVANRVDRRFRGTVGYLTNTRVVPVEAWREAAFAERLRLVRDAWLDASRWDSVYAKPVLDALDNPEVLKIDLLETCSNASRASWGEAVPVSVPLPNSPCNHWRDLTISSEVSPAGIHLSLRYRLDTVPPADAERLVTKVLEHLERGCEA